jgi:hypothetical protein
MRFKSFFLVLTLIFLPGIAAADLEEGFQAYERGDYEAAVNAWLPLAEQGDVTHELGATFGPDVSRNTKGRTNHLTLRHRHACGHQTKGKKLKGALSDSYHFTLLLPQEVTSSVGRRWNWVPS